MSSLNRNPYPGPRTFYRDEADLFFGRESEAQILTSLVASERMVLFYAKSGAGKSSLINTRLIPQLEEIGFLVLPKARVSGELPEGVSDVDNIYTFNLMLSLEKGNGDPNRLAHINLSHFLARLTSTDGEEFFYNDHAITDALEEGYEKVAYVLIIDQFEEIITAHPENWDDRTNFFRQLNQAMANDPLLWVVLTVREDNVAALDPYAPLLAGNMQARYYMQRMDSQAALEAIIEPAYEAGRDFTQKAAKELVKSLRQVHIQKPDGAYTQVTGQFVEPVQLQVVCYQLWENLKDRPEKKQITTEDLNLLAGHEDWGQFIDKALSQFYETNLREVISAAPEAERELRDWFDNKLITEARTRGTVFRGQETSGDIATEIADALVDRYLLRRESRAGGTWYELIHDRFVDPIVKANWNWRRPIQIIAFEVKPSEIVSGEAVQITWEVAAAEEVTIQGISPEKRPLKGSVSLQLKKATTFTLRAERPDSGAQAEVRQEKVRVISKRAGRRTRLIGRLPSQRTETASQEIAVYQWEELCDGINREKFIPVISNTVRMNHIFDVDHQSYLGAEPGDSMQYEDEGIGSGGLNVSEELSMLWAEYIGYPIVGQANLAQVAEYNRAKYSDDRQAKTYFLEFLKLLLLNVVEADPEVTSSRIEDVRQSIDDLSFSDTVRRLGYPRYDETHRDPLKILARFPFPRYITTSYFDFLEDALRAEDKFPRTQLCLWNGEPTDVSLEHQTDPDFKPTAREPLVYHLYGLEEYIETLVLSETDYLDFLVRVSQDVDSRHAVIPLYLQAAMAESSLILLGYSRSDWDFRILDRVFRKSRTGSGLRQRPDLMVMLEPLGVESIAERTKAQVYLNTYVKETGSSIWWGSVGSFAEQLWERWLQWGNQA